MIDDNDDDTRHKIHNKKNPVKCELYTDIFSIVYLKTEWDIDNNGGCINREKLMVEARFVMWRHNDIEMLRYGARQERARYN